MLLGKGLFDASRSGIGRAENRTDVTLGDPVLYPGLNTKDRLYLIRSFVNDTNAANNANQQNQDESR